MRLLTVFLVVFSLWGQHLNFCAFSYELADLAKEVTLLSDTTNLMTMSREVEDGSLNLETAVRLFLGLPAELNEAVEAAEKLTAYATKVDEECGGGKCFDSLTKHRAAIDLILGLDLSLVDSTLADKTELETLAKLETFDANFVAKGKRVVDEILLDIATLRYVSRFEEISHKIDLFVWLKEKFDTSVAYMKTLLETSNSILHRLISIAGIFEDISGNMPHVNNINAQLKLLPSIKNKMQLTPDLDYYHKNIEAMKEIVASHDAFRPRSLSQIHDEFWTLFVSQKASFGSAITAEKSADQLRKLLPLDGALALHRNNWMAVQFGNTTQTEIVQAERDLRAVERSVESIDNFGEIYECSRLLITTVQLDKTIVQKLSDIREDVADFLKEIETRGSPFNISDKASHIGKLYKNRDNDTFMAEFRTEWEGVKKIIETLDNKMSKMPSIDSAQIKNIFTSFIDTSQLKQFLACYQNTTKPAEALNAVLPFPVDNLKTVGSSIADLKPLLASWNTSSVSSERRETSMRRNADDLQTAVDSLRKLLAVSKSRDAIKALVEADSVGNTTTKQSLKDILATLESIDQRLQRPMPYLLGDYQRMLTDLSDLQFASVDTDQLELSLSFVSSPPALQQNIAKVGRLDLQMASYPDSLRRGADTLRFWDAYFVNLLSAGFKVERVTVQTGFRWWLYIIPMGLVMVAFLAVFTTLVGRRM